MDWPDTMNQRPSSGGRRKITGQFRPVETEAGSMDCTPSLFLSLLAFNSPVGGKIPTGAHAAHPGGGIGQRRKPEKKMEADG